MTEEIKRMKKDFQSIIGTIRNETGDKAYPKPMMTSQQIDKDTATVNCGGEWRETEETKERAEKVMNDERFKAFLEKYGATAQIELDNFKSYQIRINY